MLSVDEELGRGLLFDLQQQRLIAARSLYEEFELPSEETKETNRMKKKENGIQAYHRGEPPSPPPSRNCSKRTTVHPQVTALSKQFQYSFLHKLERRRRQEIARIQTRGQKRHFRIFRAQLRRYKIQAEKKKQNQNVQPDAASTSEISTYFSTPPRKVSHTLDTPPHSITSNHISNPQIWSPLRNVIPWGDPKISIFHALRLRLPLPRSQESEAISPFRATESHPP